MNRNKSSFMMKLTIISLIISLFAIIPLGVYFLHWIFYSPKPFIRVSGEQTGDPIQIPEKGKVFFAVSTESNLKTKLLEVWVSFNPDEVDLFKTKGAEQRGIVDSIFPFALLFPEQRIIIKGNLQGNYFEYEPKKLEFLVKFTTISEPEQAELPFLINMFPPRKIQIERIVKFQTVKGYTLDLQRNGLKLLPGEYVHLEGVQSQEAVYAATEEGVATLKVREIIDNQK